MRTLQNVIACFYDCDKTLIPGDMQEKMLREHNIEPRQFWDEAGRNVTFDKSQGVNHNSENAYMNLFLDCVEGGRIPNLSNQMLREYGQEIDLFPGLPDFFLQMKNFVKENQKYSAHQITLENYIISTGLKEMILGSDLNQEACLDGIFASEFSEKDGVIKRIARSVGFMQKTVYLHEVNKGVNVYPHLDVNEKIPHKSRRVPFQNMIYVGDGFTDVPCFALINDRGGKSLGVYDQNEKGAFEQAYKLQEDERVFTFSIADYSKGSANYKILEHSIRKIADQIVEHREEEIKSKVGQ